MNKIEVQTATVYYSPSKKRRYLTKMGAAKAEATATMVEKHPYEEVQGPEDQGSAWYDELNAVAIRDRLAKRYFYYIGKGDNAEI